jgi:hypothetical protein
MCRWFSPDTPVSSTNKAVRHDIAEILLKVALNTHAKIAQNNNVNYIRYISALNLLVHCPTGGKTKVLYMIIKAKLHLWCLTPLSTIF